MSVPPEDVNAAVNAASEAAREIVLSFALCFDRREDYLPLEVLAGQVQQAVVRKASAVLRDRRRER